MWKTLTGIFHAELGPRSIIIVGDSVSKSLNFLLHAAASTFAVAEQLAGIHLLTLELAVGGRLDAVKGVDVVVGKVSIVIVAVALWNMKGVKLSQPNLTLPNLT